MIGYILSAVLWYKGCYRTLVDLDMLLSEAGLSGMLVCVKSMTRWLCIRLSV